MGHHDPLGRAGGAAGVDQVAAEVGCHVGQPLVQLLAAFHPLTHRHQLAPAQHILLGRLTSVLMDKFIVI